ncbi:hypothetical protein PPACK8108_LOCUS22604 [Phakopsora pachyrhizi]|uniref:Uncharacterized protein n=1 Tax=Phakopsora pachyrhizi TaxID=170000 RepID=A0AAV0BMA7_PHAPC|nr:hypothetical protein PPACK8108_LOCUS22604 [Phakopsora pachyrhizi]
MTVLIDGKLEDPLNKDKKVSLLGGVICGQRISMGEGIEGEDEEDSPHSEYELEKCMRQRKGLREKTTDKIKRLSKIQRTVVQVHCQFLLGVQDRDLATISPPPTTQEVHAEFVPDRFETGPSVSRQTKAYKSFVKLKILKLGLHQFSWDWDSSWTHPFNELMSIIFL